MENQFLNMVSRSQNNDVAASTPPFKNAEEYPETCSQECEHTQCSSWGTTEMEGKRCRNKTKTNEQIQNETQNTISQAIERAFKPLGEMVKRLERLEEKFLNEPDYHSPAFSQATEPLNGERITLFPHRLDSGRNQSRITEINEND